MFTSARADFELVICFFQAEDGIRDIGVTGVQTCALPISCGVGAQAERLTVAPGNEKSMDHRILGSSASGHAAQAVSGAEKLRNGSGIAHCAGQKLPDPTSKPAPTRGRLQTCIPE